MCYILHIKYCIHMSLSHCHHAMMHMGHPLQRLCIQDNYLKRVQRPPEGPEGPPSPPQELEGERGGPRTSSTEKFYNILYITEQSHSWMSHTIESRLSKLLHGSQWPRQQICQRSSGVWRPWPFAPHTERCWRNPYLP